MRRLLFLIAALAVLLAPFAMLGGGAAMAMPHMAATESATGHCAGMDEPAQDRSRADIDCMMACAAIASLETRVEARMIAPAPLPHFPVILAAVGLDPEAETPPPRFS